ncbi:hypothetical protein PGT21_013707 [Puccinia graminis f. sp. tritici]|uniref:Secreted protein n=1 Tax=Puccinia graminis f. sp. tritici TaxID=56615 RepID=A0A5B0SE36_PUCGR|nr:hypothetical protein PGT21_013707 [Puccinia graminis f. sp. tritici]KAA1136052.1 hypothetical protein PGTUg99_025143 [Puccinia graminis f. sp. tritici]
MSIRSFILIIVPQIVAVLCLFVYMASAAPPHQKSKTDNRKSKTDHRKSNSTTLVLPNGKESVAIYGNPAAIAVSVCWWDPNLYDC